MAIRVLDKHTAELIAAGEVVERPSSVVKELCENAIDAGAKNIFVEIERGGVSLIRVGDDGGGIEETDIPLAFLRHATSKVKTKEDLDAIYTLGFRGEALASIASVAQVELLTQTESGEFASLYAIAGGEEKGLEAAARPQGTTISVHNLFYNTPARMKFLKKDASEGGFVTEVVTRLALSHPEISFKYTREGKQVFATPGDGTLKGAAYAVLGREFSKDLLEVEGGQNQYAVKGLVTPPRAARASRSMQFFYINGRFVKNRTIMAALEQAYRGMVMQGRFPGGILFLEMPPELVDVNVHPAKTEVRFARENEVFDVVYKNVKSALLQAAGSHSRFVKTEAAAPAAAAPQDTAENPPQPPAAVQAASAKAVPPLPEDSPARIRAYNQMVNDLAAESTPLAYQTAGSTPAPPVWRERALDISEEFAEEEPAAKNTAGAPPLYRVQEAGETPPVLRETAAPAGQLAFTPQHETLRLVGEIFKTYIVAEKGGSMYLVDKHAAHERLLYEKLIKETLEPDVQQLLLPVTITLSAEEKNALLQNTESLLEAGLEVEEFGAGSVVVRGIPADIEPASVEDLVIEVAGRLALNPKDNTNQKTEWVMHSVACRAAVKAGDKTPPEGLLVLAQQILDGEIPPFCPHGRPVVLEITRKELEKQFGRLG